MLGTKVAELLVGVGVDLKDFNKGMGRLEKRLAVTGARMQKVGRSMTMGLTLPLLAAGAAAVKVASDAAEMRSKFNVVFPSSGQGIVKQMTEFAAVTNQSKHEMIGLTATVGDILKPLGFTEQAAANLSVEMVQLAVDLSSFNNMPMDEALQRLQGTLVGSHENALKFGVVINENVLKQELLRMGADKLTGAQKEQAKVQARINLLLKGTTDAQGDAEKTADGFAGQVRGLQNDLKDLGVEVGTVLLPAMTDLVGKTRDLVGWFSALSATDQKIVLWGAATLAALGPIATVMGTIAKHSKKFLPVIAAISGLGATTLAAFAAVAAVIYNAPKLVVPDYVPPSAPSVEPTLDMFAGPSQDPLGFYGPRAGGVGGGGGGGDGPAWVADIAEGVEKVKILNADLAKIPIVLRESGIAATELFGPITQFGRDIAHELQFVSEQVRHIKADMTIAFVDGFANAIGKLATLQMSFKDFLGTIKRLGQQILADVIAMIVKQKILNALKMQEATISGATGVLGLGGILSGIGALALGAGAIFGIAKAVQSSHAGSQVGSFHDNTRGKYPPPNRLQLIGTAVASGDIHFSAQTRTNRLRRLGA